MKIRVYSSEVGNETNLVCNHDFASCGVTYDFTFEIENGHGFALTRDNAKELAIFIINNLK